MLKSIDILIGLSLVMLFVSMAVTLVTQALLSIRQTRGRHLLRGLADLVGHIDSALAGKHAEEIAKLILTSPLINGGKVGMWTRYGDVIHREELTRMLFSLATDEGKTTINTSSQESALAMLRKALEANGIADPEKTLEKVRMAGLRLEQSNPELASDVRQQIAFLQEASSQFLAKINHRFDQTIDRVSERFTFSARIWTLLAAALVAVILQLDAVALINRLAMDDAMRSAFVQQATSGVSQPAVSPTVGPASEVPKPSVKPIDSPSATGKKIPLETSGQVIADWEEKKSQQYYLAFLAKQGVITPPGTPQQWLDNWQHVNIPGVILTILLLSMGAPFWYSMLSKLLQLRSPLAAKDDVQRTVRQTLQPTEQKITEINLRSSTETAQTQQIQKPVEKKKELDAFASEAAKYGL